MLHASELLHDSVHSSSHQCCQQPYGKLQLIDFKSPREIHLRFSLFASEFVQPQDYWTIQPKIYYFFGLYGTRFDTFAGHRSEFQEALSLSVNTYMMSFHISDILMQWKMTSFDKQSGGATSSCQIVQLSEIGEVFQQYACIAIREGTLLNQNEILCILSLFALHPKKTQSSSII